MKGPLLEEVYPSVHRRTVAGLPSTYSPHRHDRPGIQLLCIRSIRVWYDRLLVPHSTTNNQLRYNPSPTMWDDLQTEHSPISLTAWERLSQFESVTLSLIWTTRATDLSCFTVSRGFPRRQTTGQGRSDSKLLVTCCLPRNGSQLEFQLALPRKFQLQLQIPRKSER